MGFLRPLLYLFLILYTVRAHELCLDSTDPQNVVNSFCADYNTHSCCSTAVDQQIQQYVASIGASQTCTGFISKLMCAKCDPWAQHLFGVETGGGTPKQTPYMCPQYCADFYSQCGNEVINWPASTGSPFGTNKLTSSYSTEKLFCKYYSVPDLKPCYSGAKYVPQPPSLPQNVTEGICVEYLAPNGGLNPGAMIVSVVDPHDDSGRLFVQYKHGELRAMNRTTGVISATPFLKLNGLYNTDGEAGFTSVVFHPQFKTNGRFFVHYSTLDKSRVPCKDDTGLLCGTGATLGCDNVTRYCNCDHVSVIAEFRAASFDAADPTEHTLIVLAQTFAIHNHGQLLFGPEGYLYLFWGDGGSRYDPYTRSQAKDTYLGKVLRIDVDSTPDAGLPYKIPTDNPHYGDASWSHWEVWAHGMRHPWRCSFDRADKSYLFCGDVGQEDREEVDLIVKGGNYGWRKYEGTLLDTIYPNEPDVPDMVPPAIEYTHNQMGGSPGVIGGYRYRGARDTCQGGRYLFADWQGFVFYATETAAGSRQFNFSMDQRLTVFAAPRAGWTFYELGNILGFGEDDQGDVYIIGGTGIYRIVERSVCGMPTDCKAVPATSPPPETTTAQPSSEPATTTPVPSSSSEEPATTEPGSTDTSRPTTTGPTKTMPTPTITSKPPSPSASQNVGNNSTQTTAPSNANSGASSLAMSFAALFLAAIYMML